MRVTRTASGAATASAAGSRLGDTAAPAPGRGNELARNHEAKHGAVLGSIGVASAVGTQHPADPVALAGHGRGEAHAGPRQSTPDPMRESSASPRRRRRWFCWG